MYEDKIWFNQSLMYHRDKEFTKNGVLEISINNNTGDYKTFSTVGINLSISNDTIRKLQFLNYQNIKDLLKSLEEVANNKSNIYSAYASEQKVDIIKKYTKDKSLKFLFQLSKSSQEKLCIISIINNDSDFTRVAIDFDLLLVIINLLKSFVENYINININFTNRCISTEALNQIINMRDSIKTLPSFLGSVNIINNESKFTSEEMNFDSVEVENNLNELNEFLGKDMSNITIPEIDKPKEEKKKEEPQINNDFIDKFLRNNLEVLENVIISSSIKENPFLSIVSNIKNELNEEIIPEISNNDLKSISYITKKLYLEIFRRYTELGEKIPTYTTVLKYNILDSTKIKEINKSIALDLFLILSYLKNLRDRLELRESDGIKNKSLFYIGFRLFFDPLLLTFLSLVDSNIIKSLIKDRFNKYSKIGFFNTYNKLLESYGLDEITEKQIISFIGELLDKNLLNECNVIEISHRLMFEKEFLKIPYENNLTLEQIINEVIPVELDIKFNKDNIKDNTRDDFGQKTKVSPEVAEYMFATHTPKPAEKKPKKSLIERGFQFYIKEIPIKHKEEFGEYLKKLGKENFKIDDLKIDMNELGDNILKTIYVWNNSDKTETYAEFYLKVEECIVDRNTILSSLTLQNEVKVEEQDDWSKALED